MTAVVDASHAMQGTFTKSAVPETGSDADADAGGGDGGDGGSDVGGEAAGEAAGNGKVSGVSWRVHARAREREREPFRTPWCLSRRRAQGPQAADALLQKANAAGGAAGGVKPC